MRLTSFQRIRTLVQVGLVLALSALIVACGEDEKQANEAAKWLENYSQTNPPNQEWVTTNVAVNDQGHVVMDVLVSNQGQVDLVKSRTPIEQSHIVRMACPPKSAEIWKILSTAQVLWINLMEKMPSGLYKPLTGASCKH